MNMEPMSIFTIGFALGAAAGAYACLMFIWYKG